MGPADRRLSLRARAKHGPRADHQQIHPGLSGDGAAVDRLQQPARRGRALCALAAHDARSRRPRRVSNDAGAARRDARCAAAHGDTNPAETRTARSRSLFARPPGHLEWPGTRTRVVRVLQHGAGRVQPPAGPPANLIQAELSRPGAVCLGVRALPDRGLSMMASPLPLLAAMAAPAPTAAPAQAEVLEPEHEAIMSTAQKHRAHA